MVRAVSAFTSLTTECHGGWMPDINVIKSAISATLNPAASRLVAGNRQKMSVTLGADAGQKNSGEANSPPPKSRSRTDPLGQADGGAVAVGRDREHARGRGGGVALRKRPPPPSPRAGPHH